MFCVLVHRFWIWVLLGIARINWWPFDDTNELNLRFIDDTSQTTIKLMHAAKPIAILKLKIWSKQKPGGWTALHWLYSYVRDLLALLGLEASQYLTSSISLCPIRNPVVWAPRLLPPPPPLTLPGWRKIYLQCSHQKNFSN